jgi:hypothetical protein
MNYHLEHHMFPMVPYHNLARLHEAMKADCPKPYNGFLAAWREIIPVLFRQLKDPAYCIQMCRGAAASPDNTVMGKRPSHPSGSEAPCLAT